MGVLGAVAKAVGNVVKSVANKSGGGGAKAGGGTKTNGGGGSGNSGGSGGSNKGSGGDGYTPTTFSNKTNTSNPNDYWTLDHRDGSLYHYVNGKGYQVMKNDSLGRYDPGMQSYLEQNGGYADTSTQNNPMGFEKAAGYLQDNAEMSQKAIQQGIDAAVNRLKGNIGDVNAQYDSANRGAYVNYMQGQKSMAQQLKSMGLTKTGASESTMLGANTDYANQVNSNEAAREKAIRDIMYQIADVEANGAKSLADSSSSINSQLANLYTQQLAAQVAQRNADREFQQNLWQNRTDNTLAIANMLMGMNATGKTVYGNLYGTIPGFTSADMNAYNLDRSYNMEQINQLLQQALQNNR